MTDTIEIIEEVTEVLEVIERGPKGDPGDDADSPVTSVNGLIGDVVIFAGLAKITVSDTAPSSPAVGDLWVDTSD